MKIICKNATPEQLKRDYQEIVKHNEIALKRCLTWKVFGGIITVGNRTYQVVN
jgi:hypothetical protein